MIDQVLVNADRSLLVVLGVAYLIISLLQSTLSAGRSWTVAWIGAAANVQWTSNILSHMLKLPLSWFEKRHVGDIVSRVGAANTIQQTLTSQFLTSVLDGGMSVIMLGVMAAYSVPLTLLVAGTVLFYCGLRAAFFKPLRAAQESYIVQSAKQQTDIIETIRGILSIKVCNQRGARLGLIVNSIVGTTNRSVAVQRLNIGFSTLSQVVTGCGKVVLVWIAARQVLASEMSAGMFVAFLSYADQFTTKAAGLVDKGVDLSMLRLQAERLSDITVAIPERDPEIPWTGELADLRISVRNLSFRYDDNSPWVLRDVSFEVNLGESVAIIGPSGCGKSTLAKVLCGLLEPQQGEVLLGGVPIKSLGMDRYRSLLGAVMQDDQLFAGSIAENIAFDGDGIDSERVKYVAEAAAIHDDILRMPMGYQTPVGDMGSALSGGQRQRIFIARALYRNPRILVLDEATSHLDLSSEAAVSSFIKSMNTTRIIIAHRTETIKSADRVIDLGGQASHAFELRKQVLPGSLEDAHVET